MSAISRIVIVDTNCYVRLYYSPLRPMLGQVVSGYRLVTLRELADESRDGTALVERNAWLMARDIQIDVRSGVLSIEPGLRREYVVLARFYREAGDRMLRSHCMKRGINVRTLSLADALALTVAMELDATLATDEWPLRLVAGAMDDPDHASVALFSTLDLLQLLEAGGRVSRLQRIDLVKTWLRAGENLLSNWRDDYRRLFEEPPPVVQ